MKRNEGGCGLISVEECVRVEEKKLESYLRESTESLLVAANDILNYGSVNESGTEYKEREMREFASVRSNEWMGSD